MVEGRLISFNLEQYLNDSFELSLPDGSLMYTINDFYTSFHRLNLIIIFNFNSRPIRQKVQY